MPQAAVNRRLCGLDWRRRCDRVRWRVATVSTTADRILTSMNVEQKLAAKNIFLRLTEPGKGREDTRRRVRRAELSSTSEDPQTIEQVLHILIEARLMTTHAEEVEVAHEALIREWTQLRTWLEENREAMALQNELSADAKAWEKNKRHASYLYPGVRLLVLREQLTRHQLTPDLVAQAFIHAGQKLHRRTRFVQVGTILLVIGLVIAALVINQLRLGQVVSIQQNALTGQVRANATIVAGVTQQAMAAATLEVRSTAEVAARETAVAALIEADQERLVARSRELTVQSASELSQNHYASAILLAIEAGRASDTLEAFAAIRGAIGNGWHSRVIFYGVNQATWSKDESRLLTTSADHTARIWDATTGQTIVTFYGHTGGVYQAAWNKDESRLLTISSDDTARIWDAATSDELVQFPNVDQATWS